MLTKSQHDKQNNTCMQLVSLTDQPYHPIFALVELKLSKLSLVEFHSLFASTFLLTNEKLIKSDSELTKER